jgi:hypothetical protein
MRTSCIQHPTAEPLIIVRTWQLVATNGNKAGAALLSFFEYWHNHRLEAAEKAAKANEVAEMHGEKGTHSTSLLQFHSTTDLEKGLLLFKSDSIREGIKILEKIGFVSIYRNPNPRYRFDKTKYFLFHPQQVNEWIMGYTSGINKPVDSCKDNPSRSLDNPSRSLDNPSRSLDNPSALYIEITSETTPEITRKYPEPLGHQNLAGGHINTALCVGTSVFLEEKQDRQFGFRVDEEQPKESIIPLNSNLVDSNSAESIAFPETSPIPKPPSLPAAGPPDSANGGKFTSLLDRFKSNKSAKPKPSATDEDIELSRKHAAAMAAVQSERYKDEWMDDPDKDIPGVSKMDKEAPLDIFVASLADELDRDTLLAIIGPVNEPMPGQAPHILVERIWDTYRQWRPNAWQEPAPIEKSRILRMAIGSLWRKIADPSKSTAENVADIELRFRSALLYLHAHPWYSSPEFGNQHLGYLLTLNRSGISPFEKYAECWETVPRQKKCDAQILAGKLQKTREVAADRTLSQLLRMRGIALCTDPEVSNGIN